jgi:ComF family protein
MNSQNSLDHSNIRKALRSASGKIARTSQASATAVLDLLLPPRCLACGEAVVSTGALCASCWTDITFIDGPMCQSCGLPFDYDEGQDMQCGVCLREPPPYALGRSVMHYGDACRDLVLGFKHGDRTDTAPMFGAWLHRAGKSLLRPDMLVVPVPLHRWRLFSRRFNQSALLAQALVRFDQRSTVPSSLSFQPDLLVRKKRTRTQGGLSARARHLNVRGAFAVRNRHRRQLRDVEVLLIDDVMTTGATLDACTKALLKSGAAGVHVLTLARVVRPSI